MTDRKHHSVPSLPSDLLRTFNRRRAFAARLIHTTAQIRSTFNRPFRLRQSTRLTGGTISEANPAIPSKSVVFMSSRGLRFARSKGLQRRLKRRRVGAGVLALKKVRKLERKVEVKLIDLNVQTIANVSTTGDVRNIALVSGGDLINQRDGNSIAPFFLQMNMNWTGIIAGQNQIMRTIIFRDKRQVKNTVPALSDVLTSGHPLALFSFTNRTRWKILFDRTWTASEATADAFMAIARMSAKLSLLMRWNSGTNTTLEANGLFMLNVTNVTSNLPSFIFSSRMMYNDS